MLQGPDDRDAPPARRRLLAWVSIFALVILGVALVRDFTAGLGDSDAAAGEREFIVFGEHSFRLAFVERDWHSPEWAKDYFKYGASNPQIGKYLIGASLYAHGYGRQDAGTLDHWKGSNKSGWKTVPGRRPTRDVVRAARLPIALMGIGTCLLVLVVGSLLGSRWAAVFSAALLATNELFRLYSRVVLTDVPEVFFACLTLLVLLWSVRRWDGRPASIFARAGLVGVFVALATSTKLRALLALLAAIATYLGGSSYYWVRRASTQGVARRPRHLLAAALVVVIASTALFVAFNPYLWSHTVARTGQLLSIGHLGKVFQRNATLPKDQLPYREQALLTPEAKVLWFWRLNFVDQGVLVRGKSSPAAALWRILGVMLTVAGLVGLARDAIRDHRGGLPPLRACFLLWVLVSVAGVLVWTPFRWSRYYLYLFPLWALLIGRGLELSTEPVIAWFKTRRS